MEHVDDQMRTIRQLRELHDELQHELYEIVNFDKREQIKARMADIEEKIEMIEKGLGSHRAVASTRKMTLTPDQFTIMPSHTPLSPERLKEIQSEITVEPVSRHNHEMYEVRWKGNLIGEGHSEQGARKMAIENLKRLFGIHEKINPPPPKPKASKPPKILPPGVVEGSIEAEMQKEAKGKCPPGGCIKQDSSGKWRIISNKTGKEWPQHYDSEQSAHDALSAYHAHQAHSNALRTVKGAISTVVEAIEVFAKKKKKKKKKKGKKTKYKSFSKKQKEVASENIREHHHHIDRHPGGHEQAIAIGLSQAERGEKE